MKLPLLQSPPTRESIFVLLAVSLALWLLSVVVKTVRWRLYMRKLGAQGLPMPPHNLLFGHFPIVLRIISGLPADAHPSYYTDEIRRMYPDLGPSYYLDLAPFADSMLVIGSPDMNHQLSHEHPLEKTEILRDFIRPLTDGLDFLTMEHSRWKKWRSLFNPGFSAAHLMTTVPVIVKEAETLTRVLEGHAEKQDIFTLKTVTDYLTLDITGRIVLGTDFNSQTQRFQPVESLRTKIRWFRLSMEPNLITRYNPVQPLVQWYHGRIVDAYVSKKFDERVEALNTDKAAVVSSAKRSRTIIDMVIAANSELTSEQGRVTVDPHFKKMCMSQIKLFWFAGHDTTSTSICYQVYLLSLHPEILKRVQEEHSNVFGSDPAQAASAISTSPYLLNEIPVTTAVIKESMRLFPPVTISRQGESGYSVNDSKGRSYPTGDLTVFQSTHAIHHDPAYWPNPTSFNPDRWLVGPDDPLYPVKGAWRGFEHGPHNCLGQELATLEMKVALVVVARRFVFQAAYDEMDMKAGKVSRTVHGEKAYQVNSMKPRNEMPVRVSLA